MYALRMRLPLIWVAATIACSHSTPCAADFSCQDADQVCNLLTGLCEVHETCAIDAGVGLSGPGRCADGSRPRCADLLVPVPGLQASSGRSYRLLCTGSANGAKGSVCAISYLAGPIQIDGTTAMVETGRDSCADGHTCVAPAGGPSGTCLQLCGADADCDASATCLRYHPVSQSRGSPFDSGLCVSRCSGPFAMDCAGICLPNGNAYACIPPGTTGRGGACRSRLSACAPGLACLSLMQGRFLEAQCFQTCDATHPCISGTCTAPVWSDGVGVCQ